MMNQQDLSSAATMLENVIPDKVQMPTAQDMITKSNLTGYQH
jgi:hypothetical protein